MSLYHGSDEFMAYLYFVGACFTSTLIIPIVCACSACVYINFRKRVPTCLRYTDLWLITHSD